MGSNVPPIRQLQREQFGVIWCCGTALKQLKWQPQSLPGQDKKFKTEGDGKRVKKRSELQFLSIVCVGTAHSPALVESAKQLGCFSAVPNTDQLFASQLTHQCYCCPAVIPLYELFKCGGPRPLEQSLDTRDTRDIFVFQQCTPHSTWAEVQKWKVTMNVDSITLSLRFVLHSTLHSHTPGNNT